MWALINYPLTQAELSPGQKSSRDVITLSPAVAIKLEQAPHMVIVTGQFILRADKAPYYAVLANGIPFLEVSLIFTTGNNYYSTS